jgi:hypothetical protein
MAKRAKRGPAGRRQTVKDLRPETRQGRTIRGGKTAIFSDTPVKVPAPSGPVAIPYPN